MNLEVFLICNVHRSGSSMMMRCLEAGGMPVAYDESQEYLNAHFNTPDYVPNPNGFYALAGDVKARNVAINYDGKVLKFPFRELLRLPEYGTYHILFLKRDPEEIKKSMAAFTPYSSWGLDVAILELYDLVIDAILEKVRAQKNASLLVLQYADVVAAPTKAFEQLRKTGWKVDVEKAAICVDMSLRRFNLEGK
jgi:hypothetical protein